MDKKELKKAMQTEDQRLKAEYGFESDGDEFTPSDDEDDLVQEMGHKK